MVENRNNDNLYNEEEANAIDRIVTLMVDIPAQMESHFKAILDQ